MSKIQDLPIIENPREKALRFGIETLKDEELLALIIASGTVGSSALDIARHILDDCHNLSCIIDKPLLYFCNFKGLSKAKASAHQMKADGMPACLISQYTGLTIETIEAL